MEGVAPPRHARYDGFQLPHDTQGKGGPLRRTLLTLPEIRRRIVKKVCMQILMSELGLTNKEAKKALRVLPWLWDT